jgi:hypothetical protein
MCELSGFPILDDDGHSTLYSRSEEVAAISQAFRRKKIDPESPILGLASTSIRAKLTLRLKPLSWHDVFLMHNRAGTLTGRL